MPYIMLNMVHWGIQERQRLDIVTKSFDTCNPHSIAEINIQRIFSTAGNKLITYINYILYSCSYCCIKDENEKKKKSCLTQNTSEGIIMT